ncbi:helix-hairpin-helix domain-containing protein [Rossellomorea aquimaris]|uniref:Competence protein ComEA n=1 Tax=Rossellomorea aquimaris TaxID=189382 RepID=A0A366EJ43_9BACI|nr:helix-hairpin-helix domain-containing protein [Rossellomorea aquimaris]RBP02393.1 competence protein ComEA [Rossellomorea aquimaris]
MQSLIEKYRTVLVILVICAIVLIAYILKSASAVPVKEASFTADPVKKEKEPEKLKIVEKVFVDVKGEVVNPGLYEVRQGDRLKFVIDRAGGFTPEADKKMINLAVKVSDEMMIYVPKVGEIEVPGLAPSMPGTDTGKDRININTATQQEFETLPGIGPAKASTFIQYREEHGPFAAIEEIQNISGVGEKTFEKLKEYIYVQ